MNNPKRNKLHPAWMMVGAAFMIMAVAWGSVYNCAGIFVQPVSADLGFTRSEINATMTIRAICQLVISLLTGKIFKSSNIMKIMKVATVILILSFFSYSKANSLMTVYVLTVISSICISLMAILPLSIILSNWFETNRASAIGMAFMGSGVGGMILSALTGVWLESFGWRISYQILSLLMLVLVTPCVFFILKVHPREFGLQAYGAAEPTPDPSVVPANEGMMLSQAMRSGTFWVITTSSVFLVIAINGLMMNVAPHLANIGYSISFSANVVALTMGSLAFGKVALGKLFDRIGVKKAVLIACLATTIATFGMLFATSMFGLILTIVFVGIGCAYATVANTVLTIEFFGKKDYNSIFGVLTAIGALGSMISPIITGILFDQTGSYTNSYQISLVLSFLATLMFIGLFMQQRKSIAVSRSLV